MVACPICGSIELIWNENQGEVVCSSCGTVLDKIYYFNQEFFDKETIIYEGFMRSEIKDKESRVEKFMKESFNRKISEFEIILNNMLIDKKYREIYNILSEEGLLGGLKAKTKVALLIYFRYYRDSQYLHILQKFNIKKELISKYKRKIGYQKMTHLIDKISQISDR
ncbi:hypothetical protein BFU36_04835 [Sulfolobus sp. A20]|uniref:TFIIB-type zinc ribbon-containing protein n=1 Tax=Sulfolobaceae TaxID=118883 RepID=UPI0008461CCC|nr:MULTISPECIES: TFIIB-type zinc ribbon-containing protein [unclassified Sulfolobus]TRM73228.1 transcription initiation factor IIB family protein [Sulfolobus sp. E5]TRM77779.1 transcription initiation factor IIB family protein [Sulfolobus sp. A20-N-F8]TRM83911.1 transcription initiation factor IIB family protein [Sulfolobus sp. A20-N-F6]TRM88707.1 transcription initiation factor IIB family protein [Sulfolobus sp. C3]TRM94754.1 transcription initiation factor IIB family protein [Sulfolobus sp. 